MITGATATTTVVQRTYKFRVYPTPAQDAELREWERQLRWLYNLAQEQRLMALSRPREGRPWVDYFTQAPEHTEIVRDRPQLARVVCCARQEVLRDLETAWRRWAKGLGGKPHFKRRTDAVRIYFATPKHWRVYGRTLTFTGAASSVGEIEIRQDRPWPEGVKFGSCHLVRDVDQWYAMFPLEFSIQVAPAPAGSAVGINRGAVHAVADSDGRVVDSPAYYEQALGRIAKLSRDLDRKVPGGRNAYKAKQKLARAHRKVRRQREWWLHQQSAHYAANYATVGMEDWSTQSMTSKEPDQTFPTRQKKREINRSILDVGWYEMQRQIAYKVEGRGSRLVLVPAGHTIDEAGGISSLCSACGALLSGPATGRKHMLCVNCEHSELGDVNAARNVLRRALEAPPPAPKRPKVSTKIKGRRSRVAPETTGKPPADACGGEPPVRGPDETGTSGREAPHPERTVEPRHEEPQTRNGQ